MTAKELRRLFEEDLLLLQEECKHESVTDWIPYYWAPGHGNGTCRVCENCDKIIEHKQDFPDFEITTNLDNE